MTSENDTNEQAEVTEPEVKPYSGETPGQLLREAREAKGLTTQQVADSLRLRRAVVEMIEADEYEKLASATFVRGYLRSFSKALEVDEDRVFKAYAAMGYGDIAASAITMQSFSKRKVRERNDNRLMIISYIIIAVVIALAVAWWWQSGNGSELFSANEESATSQVVQDEDEAAGVQGRVTESAARRNVQSTFADTAESDASEGGSGAVGADSEGTDAAGDDAAGADMGGSGTVGANSEGIDAAGTDTAGGTMAGSDTVGANSDGTDTASGDAAGTNMAGSGAVGSDSEGTDEVGADSESANAADTDAAGFGPESAGAQAANASGSNAAATGDESDSAAAASDLVFEFSGECWVKVADATGETLAIGVKAAGYRMPISGTPPFELILCKPEFVNLTYNGEPVDLSEYRRNRSVTLTLN